MVSTLTYQHFNKYLRQHESRVATVNHFDIRGIMQHLRQLSGLSKVRQTMDYRSGNYYPDTL
jgi:hypothetical protein